MSIRVGTYIYPNTEEGRTAAEARAKSLGEEPKSEKKTPKRSTSKKAKQNGETAKT